MEKRIDSLSRTRRNCGIWANAEFVCCLLRLLLLRWFSSAEPTMPRVLPLFFGHFERIWCGGVTNCYWSECLHSLPTNRRKHGSNDHCWRHRPMFPPWCGYHRPNIHHPCYGGEEEVVGVVAVVLHDDCHCHRFGCCCFVHHDHSGLSRADSALVWQQWLLPTLPDTSATMFVRVNEDSHLQ